MAKRIEGTLQEGRVNDGERRTYFRCSMPLEHRTNAWAVGPNMTPRKVSVWQALGKPTVQTDSQGDFYLHDFTTGWR